MKLNCLPFSFPTIISLDIETQWAIDGEPDPYRDSILTVQIDVPGDNTYVLTKDFERVKSVLTDKSTIVIIHNASFDSKFLLHHLDIKIANVFDTMLAERILLAGKYESASLEAVALRRLGIRLNKEVRKKFKKGQLTDEMINYAAQDATVLYPIYKQQIQELQEEDLIEVAKLENNLAPVIGRMELNGIGFDQKQWNIVLKEEQILRDNAYKDVIELLEMDFYQNDLFGGFTTCEVNLNSHDQVLELLKKQGIDLPDYRTDTLELYLRRNPNYHILECILSYKEHEKRLSWDYAKHINPITGRIHPNINQIGARTGRFAFSNPNLQQVPKLNSFRKMFVAEQGYKLITADYSQIELRVLAEVANDKVMIKSFKAGVDFHQATADIIAKALGTKPDRALGKGCNFAAIYGSSASSLASSTGVSARKWKEILKAYFNTYSALEPWYNESFEGLVKNGFTRTISGRKRRFPELNQTNSHKYRNISRNTPIQGGALDIMKLALVRVDKALEPYNARLVHTVHDELIAEVIDEDVDKIKKIVEEEMIQAGQYFLKKVPIEVDVKISKSWGG